MQREILHFDVVIIGGGPAGLSVAIKLAQLASDKDISICLLEKGAEIGAHVLSGAVLEPSSLDQLLPNWRNHQSEFAVKAQQDEFYFLTKNKSYKLPVPKQMANKNNYIISLGNLCRYLATVAEDLGVNVLPGFAATEILYNSDGCVCGVATGDMGIGKNGKQSENYSAGVEIRAKQTIFAEGCRGSLTKKLQVKYKLRQNCQPQTYGIGFKEIWAINPAKSRPGNILHSVGWPLKQNTYGGSFLYHLNNNKIAVGFVVGLDYTNPYLDPFEEFQRFKTHPICSSLLENGERISYGARAVSEGGWQSIAKLSFPGGVLVGDSAGFLNVLKIKGIHTAIKSAILAAEAVFEIINQDTSTEAFSYGNKFKQSTLHHELYQVRNIRPGFKKGLWFGLANSFFEAYLTRGKSPWTLKHNQDHRQLKLASRSKKIQYPKPDGKISFDRPSSIFLSAISHNDNQPVHLKLHNADIFKTVNLSLFDAPEQRYCPAGVYQVSAENDLIINASNCIHCKTCDIKDPEQNITWTCPEGASGPNYSNM